MQYTQPKFTLPAGGQKVSQKQWDLAFLSKQEFIDKYGEEPGDYVSQVVSTK